jgi:hypothetical protein
MLLRVTSPCQPDNVQEAGGMSTDQKAATYWLGRWLAALLADSNMGEEELRAGVALAVVAIQRDGLTPDGFNVEVDNDELAKVAGLEP